MKKILSSLAMISLVVPSAASVISCTNEKVVKGDVNNLTDVPKYSYVPNNTLTSNLNAFANDPVSILYNDGSNHQPEGYYGWELFRDGKSFQSNWVEMYSKDLKTWTQKDERIKFGREFTSLNHSKPSAIGGSVWLDKDGSLTGTKGAVVFLVSMGSKSKITEDQNIVSDSGIAYFIADGGLGTPVTRKGVLANKNLKGGPDWRDVFIYKNNGNYYYAISAGDRIEFWQIDDMMLPGKDVTNKTHKVSELLVRPLGVEVPNIVQIGENKWYISCSVQDNPILGPYQSTKWFLCTWDEAKQKFIPYSTGYHEYGTEGYAQRVNNPYQEYDPNKETVLLSRTTPLNWAYDNNIWAWKGGSYTTERVVIEDNQAKMKPLDWDDNNNAQLATFNETEYNEKSNTAIFNLTGNDLEKGFNLSFNLGDFNICLDKDKDNKQIMKWNNNVKTSLKKWRNEGGLTDNNDQIKVVWNYTMLTIYNETKGWVAHFMLPQEIKLSLSDSQKAIAKSWGDTNEK